MTPPLFLSPRLLMELIAIGEQGGSCPIWSTLKRPDEKYVTEKAYENPKFVEDIVRDIAIMLNAEDRVSWYTVSSENFESIHNHSAYAVIEHDKRVEQEDFYSEYEEYAKGNLIK